MTLNIFSLTTLQSRSKQSDDKIREVINAAVLVTKSFFEIESILMNTFD